ncbi:riboflavin biosynthesis protein RibF [Anaerotardibacter muris]|uniref:riboflavin biosynthesis protein RibF n=1 Tax=Anaerotardibacter muris TaxID=2941505 RepID=UPI00203E700F|nr:riboflavin biosynthesis protein RibF [Anaerotardibacter muris]
MARIYNIDDSFDYSIFENASCAFGVFDGVHRGHRYLLECAMRTAQEDGGRSIALTFDIDPDELFHAERLKKLMSNEQRIEMLARSGVDAVVVLRFTPEFAALSPLEFLQQTFKGSVPAHLHVGLDFHFGARAAGSVADLGEWAATNTCHIDAHNLQSEEGLPITATRIRNYLAEHELAEAERLLGRPYSITDEVQPGRGEGMDMGFSTANLIVPANRQTLSEGVYGGYAYVNGIKYRAAIAVGVSPVFEDKTKATMEVHILDFNQDIYGDQITAEFVEYIRPMIKFDSVDELIKTILSNIDHVRNTLPL